MTPRADLRYSTRTIVFPEAFAVPDTHPSVQKAYTTGDVSLKVEFNDRFSVLAYAKNVNDKLIKQSHFFGYAQVAAPRTYGVTATMKF